MRADAVDQPAAGEHHDRVNEQKCRVHPTYLLLERLVRSDEVCVGGDGDADAIEMPEEREADQQGDDQPADVGGLVSGMIVGG